MSDQAPTITPPLDRFPWINPLLEGVFAVDDLTLGAEPSAALRLRGRLLIDSEKAFARLAPPAKARGYLLVLRRREGGDELTLVRAPSTPARPRIWLHALLALATLVSVLFAYALFWSGVELTADGLWPVMREGMGFAASVLAILLGHELGHYLVSRRLGVHTSLPYLIPLPLSPMGTMGAVINMADVPPNRRAMLLIGLAGPLAGLLFAVPILLYGLSLSTVGPVPAEGGYRAEGNSLLYLALKALVYGRILPSGGLDVDLHPLAFAGWAGLLMTGVNLIPVGQLDGGHIITAWLGSRARALVTPIIGVLLLLGIWWQGWFLWAALLWLVSRRQVEPLDNVSPLSRAEVAMAIGGLVLLALLFSPIPLRFV